MPKEIPVYFDSVVISSPLEQVTPTIGKAKVRVFTKYGNRNGSYITDAVAEQLINSAINAPVVGFFDPSTDTWSSHTGPTLANAYGYIEEFLGWEPYEDTDGITRDYAVFSVVLFTKYFEEANKIMGQNQSMELDINTITGDWVEIENNEYFVYQTAEILGCCVIGAHEPCFSVSAFFAQKDPELISQYEKYSAFCANMKEEINKLIEQGGEPAMNEFEEKQVEDVSIETNEVATEAEETPVVEYENAAESTVVEQSVVETGESQVEETATEPEPVVSENYELVELQNKFDELTSNYEALQANYNESTATIAARDEEIANLNKTIEELNNSIAAYEVQQAAAETSRKEMLIEKYEKIINNAEEINNIKASVNNFSYDELESKLAILFANENIENGHEEKVPLLNPEISEFALLMKKYKKN